MDSIRKFNAYNELRFTKVLSSVASGITVQKTGPLEISGTTGAGFFTDLSVPLGSILAVEGCPSTLDPNVDGNYLPMKLGDGSGNVSITLATGELTAVLDLDQPSDCKWIRLVIDRSGGAGTTIGTVWGYTYGHMVAPPAAVSGQRSERFAAVYWESSS